MVKGIIAAGVVFAIILVAAAAYLLISRTDYLGHGLSGSNGTSSISGISSTLTSTIGSTSSITSTVAASTSTVSTTIRPTTTIPANQTSMGQIVVTNSGSTNFGGWTLDINSNGSGSLTPSRNAPYYNCASRAYPDNTIMAQGLYSDLLQIGNLGNVPGHSCAKSVSFGSETNISFNNQASGDISCTGSSDPASYQKLWNDTKLMEQQLNLSSC